MHDIIKRKIMGVYPYPKKGMFFMKKVISLLLAVLVAFTFTISSFGAYGDHGEGKFVQSPEMNYDGSIISAWYDPGNALEIVFTPFIKRDVLEKISRTKIETAYSELLHTNVISRLFKEVAGYSQTSFSSLAVSNIFDLTCKTGNLIREATITLGDFDLSHFVGLIHYGESGWELVRDITLFGHNLIFRIGNLSPFAIVVDASAYSEPTSPSTYDLFGVAGIAGAIALTCGAFIFIAAKRKKAEEK